MEPNTIYPSRINLSLTDKDSEAYLSKMTDEIINDLVIDSDYIQKAFNYYNGVRDKDQFKYLEDTYGLGTPTDVKFIPLVKQHIDYLVSEFTGTNPDYFITCKDKETLSKIYNDRLKVVQQEELNRIRTQRANSLANALFNNNNNNNENREDNHKDIVKFKSDIERDFISEYEIAAQYMLESFRNSRDLDIQNKRAMLATYLLVTGFCAYRAYSEGEDQLEIEVLNSKDVFPDRTSTLQYFKDCQRIVYRKYLSHSEIIARYGDDMTEADISKLQSTYDLYSDRKNVYYTSGDGQQGGIIAGLGATAIDSQYYPFEQFNNRLIPVYYVEWLDTNKIKEKGKTYFRQDRYETIKIGNDIRILYGRNDNAPRSFSNPHLTRCSINGVTLSNINGKPYSLIMATMDLQDEYDLLHFYRDVTISTSGSKGSWMDISQIPVEFGQKFEERLMKWEAYSKTGRKYFNSANEGREGASPNTFFNGYDDTVSATAVQAIQYAILDVERECSMFTGVFRENLANGVEQRDAVTNVQVGLKQSATITRRYFHKLDLCMKEIYTDLLNTAKHAYKTGYVGSIIIGPKLNKIINIPPEQYTNTDFDVHIGDSAEILQEKQKIEQLSYELIKADRIDPIVAIEAATSKSLTQLKENVLASIRKKEEENGVLVQLQQQLQQMQNEAGQYKQQLQQLQEENEKLKKQENQIAHELKERELTLKEKDINARIDYNQKQIDVEHEKVKLEQAQLLDHELRNDEVKY